jgi:chromosome segregation ATPase
LAQAESLKLAQQRILELEKEVEKYRHENEELASAGEIILNRSEELTSRIFALDKEKKEISESLQNELIIIKGTLQYKELEVSKARLKIEELETRLKSDFKKIRVRERELENRLELVKAEKTALLRAKDENILELKRKIDHLQSELDNYRGKVLELNKTIGHNQEQFKRTVRALRLALSNLEVKEENIVPLKKAE